MSSAPPTRLPDGFQPEGIAIGRGTTFYAGSLRDGATYRGDLLTDVGSVLVPGGERAVHHHSGIGVVDFLLAGTVTAAGADLLTINVRHFPMFDDLRPAYQHEAPEQRPRGH